MAYYYIGFQSRTGKNYELRIVDDSLNANTALVGSVEVFTTDEDTDEDVFLPVRCQTGYVRFVDTDDGQWRTIMPQYSAEKRVILLDGSNNVVWQGWLQARSYGGGYKTVPQVRSLAVECDLSVLRCYDVSPSAGQVENFAYALHYILGKCNYWNYLYFQGTDVIYWLQRRFSWSVFTELDNNGNEEASYDCLQALEEICKFFGWSARTDGQDLYFCSADDSVVAGSGWSRLEYDDLDTIGAGTSVTPTTVSWVNDELPTLCDIQSEELLQLGCRQATVVARTGYTNVLSVVDFSTIEEMYRAHAVSVDEYGSSPKTYHYELWSNLADWSPPYNPYTYQLGGVKCILEYVTAGSYGEFIVEDWFKGDPSGKHNYDWNTHLHVAGDWQPGTWQQGDPEYLARFELGRVFPLSNGMFTVNADTFDWILDGNNYVQYNRYGYLICRLKVGDKYWDGSAWQTISGSTPVTTFNIYFGPEDHTDAAGTGKIQDTRVLNGNYMPYTGCGIPVGSTVGGRIVFEIAGVYNVNSGQPRVYINNLQFGFVRQKSAALLSRDDSNRYTSTNGKKFEKRVNVETIFASNDNNDYGESIILNANGTYCSDLPYTDSGGNTTYEHPEQWLADRIAEYGKSSKRVINMQTFDNAGTGDHTVYDLTPGWKMEDGLGSIFWPMSVARKWNDGRVNLQLVEVVASSGPTPPPPPPYDAKISYLKSSGDAYINTGITLNSASSVRFVISFELPSVARRILIGNYNTDGNRINLEIQVVNSKNVVRTFTQFDSYKVSNVDTVELPLNTVIDIDATVTFSSHTYNCSYTFGGTTYQFNKSTVGSDISTQSDQFRLFSDNRTVSRNVIANPLIIHSAKLYVDGTLVRDYIPVRVGTTGYMYDNVSGELFGNNGPGSFVLGPDVV